MSFEATPTGIVELLLVSLGAAVIFVLARGKLDSNLPLFFYAGLAIFVQFTERSLDSYLFGGGLASALVLRFEFMNGLLTRWVLWLELIALAFISAHLAGDVFGLPL